MTIKKKVSRKKKVTRKKKVLLKKKTVTKRKAVHKKSVTKKRKTKRTVKKNPVKADHYVAFITGSKNEKFYYHGINFKTKGLKFSTGINSPVIFTSRGAASSFVGDMIKIFVPERKKELFPVGAELVHSKK